MRRPPIVVSCSSPCTRVMPVGLPESSFVAKLPSVATTRGQISSILRHRCPSQASISSGIGSRLPGGRHFNTFATKTSERVSPIPASNWSRSFPAAPTNGTPCWSSWKPGASPTNIRSAFGSPEPNTTCVRPCASAHFVQFATRSRYAWSSVVTATAPAAATAATRCAGLPGGADHRERRELLRHLRRAALRAGDLLVSPDELLEVRLAAHADELVDRHRLGSVDMTLDAMWERLPERLEGRIVVLEALRPEHDAALRAAGADPAIWRWMRVGDVDTWLRWMHESSTDHGFAIVLDGVPVGSSS